MTCLIGFSVQPLTRRAGLELLESRPGICPGTLPRPHEKCMHKKLHSGPFCGSLGLTKTDPNPTTPRILIPAHCRGQAPPEV
jgi:hypothetical protein